MKTAEEIIAEHTTDGENVDLLAAGNALQEQMMQMARTTELTGGDQLYLQETFVDWAVKYLAGILLQGLDELGALPNGAEEEFENIQLAMNFQKVMRTHELLRTKREQATGLYVPKGK